MHIRKPSNFAAAFALSGLMAGASILPLHAQSAVVSSRARSSFGDHRSALQPAGIAAMMDQHGHMVYVNAASSAPAAPELSQRSWDSPSQKIESIIQRVSRRHQVDPKLVDAVIRVESDYNSKAVSPKGAMGLMQLIPATAERFGVENAFDPRQNIEGGVSYLSYLLNQFDGSVPLSLAAYNAGENAVAKSGGVPAIAETRNYVREVTRRYHSERGSEQAANAASIIEYVDAQGVICFTNTE